MDDGAEMHFLSGDEWEPILQVESHLGAEDGPGACSCAVSFMGTFGEYFAEKVFVLGVDDNVCHDVLIISGTVSEGVVLVS